MEANQNSNRSPLANLIETIVEKRELTASEQAQMNKLALETRGKAEDFTALSKLTEMITRGEIKVS